MSEGRFQFGKAKRIAAGQQLRGLEPGAGQQQFVGHFAQNQSGNEGWQRENRGAVQDPRERAREFQIGHVIRRRHVDRTAQSAVGKDMPNRAAGSVAASQSWQTRLRNIEPGPWSSRRTASPQSP